MIIMQEIQQDLASLPQERLQEAWDFIRFLKFQSTTENKCPVITTSLPPKQDAWKQLQEIGKQLSASWPEGVSAADVISDMRR